MSHKLNSSASGIATKLVVLVTSLCVVFFIIGTIEFGRHYHRLSDAAFHSLQLFHLHFPEHIEPVSVPLEIARWGAALLGLSVIPLLLGLILGDRLFRYWVRFLWRNHVIVCGDSAHVLHLIRDLRQTGHRVVSIGSSADTRVNLPRGVLFLQGPAQESELLRMAAVQRAAHLIALSDDDRENLEILVAATKLCETRDPALPPLECHAHLQDPYLADGLHHAVVKPQNIRCHLFNYHEVVARLLVCRYPLPEALSESMPQREHYVIVGFGAFGQNVAIKLVKMGQQLVSEPNAAEEPRWRVLKPRITVIDPRGDDAVAAFLHGTPAFRDHCDLEVVSLAWEGAGFLDLAFLEPGSKSEKISIIVCIDDETIALRTALMLVSGRSSMEAGISSIYLRLRDPERLRPILDGIPNNPGQPRLIFFAPDREVFSADAILRKNLDTLARAVHEAWLTTEKNGLHAENRPTAAGKSWQQLSEQDRDNNREAADHTWAKLRTLGYELRPAAGMSPTPRLDPEFLAELRNREEELARAEHYRWMTWRLLEGWRYGKDRNPLLKRHPDIVAYEELPQSTKEKDKAIARAIPKLLQAGHLAQVRVEAGTR